MVWKKFSFSPWVSLYLHSISNFIALPVPSHLGRMIFKKKTQKEGILQVKMFEVSLNKRHKAAMK